MWNVNVLKEDLCRTLFYESPVVYRSYTWRVFYWRVLISLKRASLPWLAGRRLVLEYIYRGRSLLHQSVPLDSWLTRDDVICALFPEQNNNSTWGNTDNTQMWKEGRVYSNSLEWLAFRSVMKTRNTALHIPPVISTLVECVFICEFKLLYRHLWYKHLYRYIYYI